MQLFSATLQLYDSILTCPISSSLSGQYVLRCTFDAVMQWLYTMCTADLLLFFAFCAGFFIFRSMAIQSFMQSLVTADPGRKTVEVEEGVQDSTQSRSSSMREAESDSEDHSSRKSSESDIGAATVTGNIIAGTDTGQWQCDWSDSPRCRCPALRAQTGGQSPVLAEECTTIILSHIPKNCTPDNLLSSLHEHGYFGEVDFIYVPIDFKRGDCSLGFAVLNFLMSRTCLQFAAEFHMANVSDLISDAEARKPAFLEVASARLQGSKENIRHLQKSRVLSWLMPHPAWLPRTVGGGGLAVPIKATGGRSRPGLQRKPKDRVGSKTRPQNKCA